MIATNGQFVMPAEQVEMKRAFGSFLKPNTDRERLRYVETPEPTRTHYPVPHYQVAQRVRNSIIDHGYSIEGELFELSHGGLRLFGVMQLRSEAVGYSLVVGIRNSHDKSFPAALVMGSQVTVCSNLCFGGTVKISRKHTRYIQRDLPTLISSAVARIGGYQETQQNRFEAYRNYQLTDAQFNKSVVALLDSGVVPGSSIRQVIQEYRTPSHPEFESDGWSAWRLFNAVTETFKGLHVNTVANRGQRLHGLIDRWIGIA